MASGVNWSSSSWYKKIHYLRSNRRLFIQENYANEEEFMSDILQSLCNEAIGVSVKLHMLGILQEYATCVMTTAANVEEIVGSLQNLFLHTEAETMLVMQNQLLATCTSILLQSDALSKHSLLFTHFVEILLDVMCHINGSGDMHLRSMACQCLVEMETMYPNVLQRKLEYIYQAVQMENTAAAQSYMALFVSVLTNSLKNISCTDKTRHDNKVLSDLLCNRIEPLKPFSVPEELLDQADFPPLSKKYGLTATLPAHIDIKELSRVVGLLVNYLPLATIPLRYYLLQQLTQVVNIASCISPAVFRSEWLKQMSSFDILSIHNCIHQTSFHEPMCSPEDEDRLLYHILLAMNHPRYPTVYRLVIGHWLQHWPTYGGNQLGVLMSEQQISSLYPAIFDSTDVQVSKLKLVSSVLPTILENETCTANLMGCLSVLNKPVQYGISGRSASAIYRILYQYYGLQSNSSLISETNKCVLTNVCHHPELVPHTLDFVEAVQESYPDSNIAEIVYLQLVEYIVQQEELMNGLKDLSHYLSVFQAAATLPMLPAKEVIHYLTVFLSNNIGILETLDWGIGHSILDACCHLIQNHNSTDHFKAFGNLLFLIFTKYKDVDVQDRAKRYYAMLNNLSPGKVSTLLVRDTVSGGKQGLARIVTASGYQPGMDSITTLNYPVFQLSRVPEPSNNCGQGISLGHDCTDLTIDEYFAYIRSDSCEKPIHLQIKISIAEEISTEEVYALALLIETSENFSPFQEIRVPYLRKTDKESAKSEDKISTFGNVFLKIIPKNPIPTKLHVSAIFMGSEGQTFTCDLNPFHITFADLRQPIPYIKGMNDQKKELFYVEMWNHFLRNSEECLESLITLKSPFSSPTEFLDKYFVDFMMSKTSQGGNQKQFGVLAYDWK